MDRRSGRKNNMPRPDTTQTDSGNRPKKNHYTTVKMAPCKICGRESSGYHFGVVTCEACKAFFRRAISKTSRIPETCRLGNFLCAENPAKVTACPACRLNRCKELGMSKGGARKGRYSLQLRTQSILDAKMEQEKREQASHEAIITTVNGYTHDPNHYQQHQQEQQHQQHQQVPHYQNYQQHDDLEYNRLSPLHSRSTGDSNLCEFSGQYIPNGDSYSCTSYNNENSVASSTNCMTPAQNYLTSSHEHVTSTNDSVPPTGDTVVSYSDLRQNWVNKEMHEFMDEIGGFSLEPIDFTLKQQEINHPSSTSASNDTSPGDLTPSVAGAPLPLIPESEKVNFENLINELVNLQKKLFPHKNQDADILQRQKQIEEEHIQREEAYKFMFGGNMTEYVSPREFNEILTEVNIELDDRLKVLREKAKDNEKNIVQYIQHSRYIPGFHTLDLDDMLQLLKESYFEFWLFSNHVYFNQQREVSGGSDAVCNGHKKILYSLFPPDYVDAAFAYTDTLKQLKLSLEEVSVIRVIILTFTDRCQLKYPSRVEKLQTLFTKCLIYQLSKTEDHYLSRFCRIIERLVEIRTLTNMNTSVNSKFLIDWSDMLKDFPLWREMISRCSQEKSD